VGWKKWYDENKERLNSERRRRYREDKAYRERMLEAGRKWRERTKPKTATSGGRAGGPMPIKYISINGRQVKVYSNGTLAKMLGIKIGTLRVWLARGIIPEATYRDDGENRLWTEDQVDVILTARKVSLTQQGNVQWKSSAFPQLVKAEFDKMPNGIRGG